MHLAASVHDQGWLAVDIGYLRARVWSGTAREQVNCATAVLPCSGRVAAPRALPPPSTHNSTSSESSLASGRPGRPAPLREETA